MQINRTNLDNLFIGFNASFQRAFDALPPRWKGVAMLAQSGTRESQYAWLKQVKGMREWVGDRVVSALETDGYRIVNKPFENTVGVPKWDIEDDQVGLYGPMFEHLGASAAEQPDRLIFALLKSAFATTCYDGQYFIDTDHPRVAADGSATTWSNSGGGAGTPWYLLSTKRPIKPLILQERTKAKLTRLDDDKDANVFNRAEFTYGVEWRGAAGFGLPQLAYGSKQTLDPTNYAAARGAMTGLLGDHDRPLGIVPDLLVVPPSLEGAGRQILKASTLAGGGDNVWFGTAELLVEPLLA